MSKTANIIEAALREVIEAQTWTHCRDVLWGNEEGQFIVSPSNYPREIFYHSLATEQHEVGVAVLDGDSNLLYQENAAFALSPPRITIGYPPGSRILHVRGLAKSHEAIQAQGPLSQTEQFIARVGNPYLFNVVDLRVRPTDPTSTFIYVEAGMYERPSAPGVKQKWAGGSEDLATAIAALTSGQHQLCVAILNTETGALTYTATTATTAVGALPSRAELTGIASITLTTGQLAVGTVYLYYGQTSVEQADCLTDLDPRLTWPPNIDWTRPGALGSVTPNSVQGTTGQFSGILTTQSGKVIKVRVVTAAGAVTIATSDDLVVVNKTVGAATIVNLPATPTTGQTVIIHDGAGDAATNALTLTPAAGNINGAGTLVLNTAYATAVVTYNGTQWDAQIGGAGGGGSGTVTTVAEADGTPSVSSVTTIKVPNGTLVNNGGGIVTIVSFPIGTCEGRLSLTSNTPITNSDVNAATSVYFSCYKGNGLFLLDSSGNPEVLCIPDAGLSLSLSGFGIHRLYDLWAYDNAGAIALDSTAWAAPLSYTITGCTNANPPVVTIGAHALVVGDIVTSFGVVGSTGINATLRVSAIAATTVTLQTLAAANPGAPGVYVSGGTMVKKFAGTARATALATATGYGDLKFKTGDTTRRFLGTIEITGTAGQCEDSVLRRLCINYYNQQPCKIVVNDATSSWSYGTTAYRAANNNLANLVEFIIPTAEMLVKANAVSVLSLAATGMGGDSGVGLDTVTASTHDTSTDHSIATLTGLSIAASAFASYSGWPAVGSHYLAWLERARTGTPTWNGTGASSVYLAGLSGEIPR